MPHAPYAIPRLTNDLKVASRGPIMGGVLRRELFWHVRLMSLAALVYLLVADDGGWCGRRGCEWNGLVWGYEVFDRTSPWIEIGNEPMTEETWDCRWWRRNVRAVCLGDCSSWAWKQHVVEEL